MYPSRCGEETVVTGKQSDEPVVDCLAGQAVSVDQIAAVTGFAPQAVERLPALQGRLDYGFNEGTRKKLQARLPPGEPMMPIVEGDTQL